MAPKAAKDIVELLSAADRDVLAESNRLQELAYEGMLSKTRRMCTNELAPSKVLAKADGKDITKRSSIRKGRYLLNINAKIAAAAAGRMGALAQLDSKNPVMYMDFPEGRLKFFGTLMFPSNKYMILRFTNKDVICEDILESMVVFSEVWWIGKKEDNPEESQLPMPQSVIEAGRKAHDASEAELATKAVEGREEQGAANGCTAAPRATRKRALADSEDSDVDDGASSQDEEDGDIPLTQGRRMSQRSTKRPKYNVDASDSDIGDGDDDEDNADANEPYQQLKKQAPVRTPAKESKQQGAEDDAGPQPRSHQVAPKLDPSEPKPTGGPSTKAQPAGNLKQATLNFGKAAKAKTPPKIKIASAKRKTADSNDSDIVDVSSPPPSQRIRPSRVASARKASLKEASSASEEAGDDEDEIENDEDDEDFTI